MMRARNAVGGQAAERPRLMANGNLATPHRAVWMVSGDWRRRPYGHIWSTSQQAQSLGLCYCLPAVVHAQFAIDVLRMRAQSAQGDHEFTGDLWSG